MFNLFLFLLAKKYQIGICHFMKPLFWSRSTGISRQASNASYHYVTELVNNLPVLISAWLFEKNLCTYLWSTGHRNISKYKLQNDWSLGLLINGVPINRLIFKETKNTYFTITYMGHDNCLSNINANVTMFLLASKLFVPTWYGRLIVVFMSKTKIKSIKRNRISTLYQN